VVVDRRVRLVPGRDRPEERAAPDADPVAVISCPLDQLGGVHLLALQVVDHRAGQPALDQLGVLGGVQQRHERVGLAV
jgi:hypothetical protein